MKNGIVEGVRAVEEHRSSRFVSSYVLLEPVKDKDKESISVHVTVGAQIDTKEGPWPEPTVTFNLAGPVLRPLTRAQFQRLGPAVESLFEEYGRRWPETPVSKANAEGIAMLARQLDQQNRPTRDGGEILRLQVRHERTGQRVFMRKVRRAELPHDVASEIFGIAKRSLPECCPREDKEAQTFLVSLDDIDLKFWVYQ